MKVIYQDESNWLPAIETTLNACYIRKMRKTKDGSEFEIYVLDTASGEFTGPLDKFDPKAFDEGDRVKIRYYEKGQFKNFYKVEKVG